MEFVPIAPGPPALRQVLSVFPGQRLSGSLDPGVRTIFIYFIYLFNFCSTGV
jgi:hypothetical protein